MNSKRKQFYSLSKGLDTLLSEQIDLFLYERNKTNWLKTEHMEAKYMDIQEAILQNKYAVIETIEELLKLSNIEIKIGTAQQEIFG